MAVTNFIQTIWSKKIQDDLELKTKLVQNCLRDYEGDVKFARSVKILGVGEPTIGDYTAVTSDGISIEEMTDRGQLLTIDQANYFAFYVDDIDKAQSVPGLPEKYQQKAVHGLATKRDTYVAQLIQDVALGNNPNSGHDKVYMHDGSTLAATECVTTAAGLTAANVLAAIDGAIVKLRERNFDEEGVIEITPAVYNVVKSELTNLSTNNPEYIKRGVIGMYDGFEVIMSNNMAKDSTYIYCDVRGKKAIAFAGQINDVESMRSEKFFKDIVRGLDTFGAKVIDAERIQVIKFLLATGSI